MPFLFSLKITFKYFKLGFQLYSKEMHCLLNNFMVFPLWICWEAVINSDVQSFGIQ